MAQKTIVSAKKRRLMKLLAGEAVRGKRWAGLAAGGPVFTLKILRFRNA
jgi:hypothetical protein